MKTKYRVVGYEGSSEEYPAPVIWGAAAVLDSKNILTNAVSGSQTPKGEQKLLDLVSSGGVVRTQVEIPIDTMGQYFVMDIRRDLYKQKPYDIPVSPIYGVVAKAAGLTRSYYVFESHEHLQSWLYHTQTGHYILVPSETREEKRERVLAEIRAIGPCPTSMMAVGTTWVFKADEASNEELIGYINGTYEGMNGELTSAERQACIAELRGRGDMTSLRSSSTKRSSRRRS